MIPYLVKTRFVLTYLITLRASNLYTNIELVVVLLDGRDFRVDTCRIESEGEKVSDMCVDAFDTDRDLCPAQQRFTDFGGKDRNGLSLSCEWWRHLQNM